jgi:hypothetical protein
VNDSSATVALRIHAKDGFPVFEQAGRWMTEVLAFFAIHDNLAIRVLIKIEILNWFAFCSCEEGNERGEEESL